MQILTKKTGTKTLTLTCIKFELKSINSDSFTT